MTKHIFTIKDIKEFLIKNDLYWTGKILDRHDETTQCDLTVGDFGLWQTFIMQGNNCVYNLEILISNCAFYIFDKDVENLSNEWSQILLSKYGKEYAKISFDWSIKRMAEIKKQCSDEINQFTKTTTDKAQNQINYYNAFAKTAMKYLSSEDIDEIAETTDVF